DAAGAARALLARGAVFVAAAAEEGGSGGDAEAGGRARGRTEAGGVVAEDDGGGVLPGGDVGEVAFGEWGLAGEATAGDDEHEQEQSDPLSPWERVRVRVS